MKRTLKTTLLTTLLAATLSAAHAQMPPGATMPPVENMPPGATMPAGHPGLQEILNEATTQPSVLGALSIQMLPGTAGGAINPSDPVTVELFHRGSPIKKISATLDAAGKVVVADLPVNPPIQVLVSITHDGLLQQVVSPELNPDQPIQSITMKVFETTPDQPAWTIAMQHLIVQWAQDGSGARITEMLSVNSPGDRAWLGNKAGEGHITLSVPLPPMVDDIELGGSFDEDASKVVDGKLVTGGALFPGRSEYRITYTLPAKDGNIQLPIVAPAAVGNLMVFLPADDTKVAASGIAGGESVDMGNGQGPVRMYRAQNLASGASVLLSIKGIKPAQPTEVAAADVIKPPGLSAKNVAMGGAFLIALIGAGMILMKKKSPVADTPRSQP